MTQPRVHEQNRAGPQEPYAGVEHSDATGWTAWILLGGFLLVFVGMVHLAAGLLALFRPQVLAGGRADMLLPVGLTGLAWIEIVLGLMALVTGVGLIRALMWARLTAIVLGVVLALVNFAFVGVHPVWSITVVVLIGVVIYSVAAHGGELARAYADT
jgi:hypothetical protein